jgi:hypothetical protein
MSDIRTDDLNTGTFATSVRIEARRTAEVKTVQVKVDNKAATRQAIIVAIRREGITFETRSAWKARAPKEVLEADWNHTSIAIHHAGNSYSCGVPGADQIHKVQDGHMSGVHSDIGYHFAIDCDGVIYEGRDIRYIGAHIGKVPGVIGIVLLADLSLRGETYKEEYAPKRQDQSFWERISNFKDWVPDKFDDTQDVPPEHQTKALFALVKVLLQYFPVTMLGGHREFQKLANKEGRACPGAYGMVLVDKLRSIYKVGAPKK